MYGGTKYNTPDDIRLNAECLTTKFQLILSGIMPKYRSLSRSQKYYCCAT